MRHEPWQDANPHIDMILVSDDLTAEHNGDWLNFCFGLTCGRFVANSVHRYKSLNDLERFLAVKAVVLHEIGHVLGAAADLNRSHTEEKIGPHCTNPNCVMRQGLNLATWVKHARECNSHGSWYCPQCLADIKNSQI
ncbi:MAG: hypothetical protein MJ154_01530 [Candidatus Saccharibacteria bacterium]|nr:hypothetical protein [Candidatus Saccharibacteria bacterium]